MRIIRFISTGGLGYQFGTIFILSPGLMSVLMSEISFIALHINPCLVCLFFWIPMPLLPDASSVISSLP